MRFSSAAVTYRSCPDRSSKNRMSSTSTSPCHCFRSSKSYVNYTDQQSAIVEHIQFDAELNYRSLLIDPTLADPPAHGPNSTRLTTKNSDGTDPIPPHGFHVAYRVPTFMHIYLSSVSHSHQSLIVKK